MKVIKRNGKSENVSFDKVLNRISILCEDLTIDPSILAQQVCGRIYDNITTTELDEFSASLSASMSMENLDYEKLSGRLIISNLHKNTFDDYSKVVHVMKDFLDPDFVEFVITNSESINKMIDYKRDYNFDYFGFKTLEKGKYLFRKSESEKSVERPQHMIMRVAIGIHLHDIKTKSMDLNLILNSIQDTYDMVSQKMYTHATPTLFNSGTKRPQLSSCFLLEISSDSIEGIYDTVKDCALISKEAGGIGLAIHRIRSKNSKINGTNGISNGLVPMLKVFNETAKYVDQCLTPDTIVYTTDGPMEIQYCSAQDTHVYNLNGGIEKIQNVLEHSYNGEILWIDTFNSIYTQKITPEHPIYCMTNLTEFNKIRLMEKLSNSTCEFDWVSAKDLKPNDMIIYKIPTHSKDSDLLSVEDCYMYGVLLYEKSTNNIIVNLGQSGIFNFLKTYMESKCIQLHTKNTRSENVKKIFWKESTILPFRHSDLFDSNGKKHIHRKWLNLPIEKSKYILKGFLERILNEAQVESYNGKYILYNVCPVENKKFLECLRFLFLKLGVLITYNTHLMIPKTTEICELLGNIFKWDQNDFMYLRFQDFILDPIKSITKKTHENGVLYDFQMEDEHNYLTTNGIVHNGGGKRKGSFAIYLEPWHADIQDFLEMKKSRGSEELRARDLFYALWIPDLFMKRVKEGKMWTLMSPSMCPGLNDCWGAEFERLYCSYEEKFPNLKKINAQELWRQILTNCVETGGPYLLFKDHCNGKSNHQHLGTIQSSNLCTEIIQFTNENETAVCNLASICLPTYIQNREFNFEKLRMVVHKIVENLNRVIDVNYYPTSKCLNSNKKHRPIGIGVQGLADAFQEMEISWEDPQTMKLNRDIFEVIYYSALEKSCELAQKHGTYESYENSPLSKGIYQFHFWNANPSGVNGICKWDVLMEKISQYGVRNSLLVAPMPTASTSQIMGFSECFEPYTSNIFIRRTNAGEFKMLNKRLITKLKEIGLWNEQMKNRILLHEGSVQWMEDHVHPDIKKIKNIFKTVWELKHKLMIDFAVERGIFIDQSQSFNVYMEEPTINKLNNAYFYSWEKGLKTCQYYLRIRTKAKAIQFTIDPTLQKTDSFSAQKSQSQQYHQIDGPVCSRDNPDCASCSS